MQAAGNMGGFIVIFMSPFCLSFLHSPIYSPSLESEVHNPICLFCLLGPQGQAVLHLVTPKAEKPGYLPLALEVTTPSPLFLPSFAFLGDFRATEGSDGREGGQPVSCVGNCLTRP